MNSACDKNWIDILSALLTPTIAIAGIAIGILQWKINQRRLKHELFDRRINIFDVIAQYIADILLYDDVESRARREFLRDTRGSFFLFGKDIDDYVKEISQKSNELHALKNLLPGLSNENQRETNLEKQEKLKEWFQTELNSLEQKFDKYLTLKG